MSKDIPDDVREKIELVVQGSYPVNTRKEYRECAEWGYSLAKEQIEKQQKRIEFYIQQLKARDLKITLLERLIK